MTSNTGCVKTLTSTQGTLPSRMVVGVMGRGADSVSLPVYSKKRARDG